MTAISLKSSSGDDYLELYDNSFKLDDIIEHLYQKHKTELFYIDLILIKSTSLDDINNIYKKLDNFKTYMYENNLHE